MLGDLVAGSVSAKGAALFEQGMQTI